MTSEDCRKGDQYGMYSESRKILISCFSHSGNTRETANQSHNRAGGGIFEIQSVLGKINAVGDRYPEELEKRTGL